MDQRGQRLTVQISPVQFLQDTLYVLGQDNQVLSSGWVEAEPLEAVRVDLQVPTGNRLSKIALKNEVLDLLEDKKLSRPVRLAEGFDQAGAYGLFLQGRDLARLRQYQSAEIKIRSSLEKDSLFLPALVEMAKLKMFRMQYDSAFLFAQKALSIDTYDGAANFHYAKAAQKLSLTYDALDGFEVATLTPEYRSAAYTALAEIHVRQKELAKAKSYAAKSLLNNAENLQSLQLLYLIARVEGNGEVMRQYGRQIEDLDPLNHFLIFEKYLSSPTDQHKSDFTEAIRNELPVETYLELAIMYANWGRTEESRKLLLLAPQNLEVLFWQAWLHRENPSSRQLFLEQAAQAHPDFVFPFREESAEVLNWVSTTAPTWKADYLLALIHDFRGNEEEAKSRLSRHQEVDFAPFFILRARLQQDDPPAQLAEVEQALVLDPSQWRYAILRSRLLMEVDRHQEAIRVLGEQFDRNKNNYMVGLELVRLLVGNDRYAEADSVLDDLHVLPFEGATDARRLYRQTKLMLAQEALEEKELAIALDYVDEAEEWPERLGVGKPFPADIDSDLENWMKHMIYRQSGKEREAMHVLKEVKNKEITADNYREMLRSISAGVDQRIF